MANQSRDIKHALQPPIDGFLEADILSNPKLWDEHRILFFGYPLIYRK